MASIFFAGAAGEVTGSRHLVEINGKHLLLDCGMFQGHRQDADAKNRKFIFGPAQVDALILSHAHLDHCGAIPRLVKLGFKGKIYCTAATADLAQLIMEDSARIQEQDAIFFAKRNPGQKIEPLYSSQDVAACRGHFVNVPLGLPFEPLPDVKAWLHEAGHILGSAQVSLHWDEAGKNRSLLFSGDLGRKNMPLLRDPFQPQGQFDVLLLESTYGDRLHADVSHSKEHLGELVRVVAARGGKVIIPSFAVGRAQELIYELAQLRDANKIPALTIFVDSPMASRATRLFEKYREILDSDFEVVSKKYDPFDISFIKHTESVEESKTINAFKGPCVIISASGMAESGRILHHLRNNLGDSRNLVLMVGYQAQGTLGRRLLDGQKQVLIYGQPVAVAAEIKSMNEYSAHADWQELTDYVKNQERPGQVFLVHGETVAAKALATHLSEAINISAKIPQLGEKAAL